MLTIYRAANITDAHLIRQILEAEGIPAFIQGEYLQGAVGELPANTEILVQVDNDHFAAARDIVDRWESAEMEHVDDEAEVAAASYPPSSSARRGASFFAVLGWVLVGTLLGSTIVWTIYNRPSDGTAIDYDDDGRIDERLFFAGPSVQRTEYDRNRDGTADQIVRFNIDGTLDVIESDDNFDGRYERTDHYLHNQPQRWAVDDESDGNVDSRGEYTKGRLFSEEWLDRQGNVIKSIRYDNGVPVSGKFDSDADGKLDISRRYDRRGEIVASEPLPAK